MGVARRETRAIDRAGQTAKRMAAMRTRARAGMGPLRSPFWKHRTTRASLTR